MGRGLEGRWRGQAGSIDKVSTRSRTSGRRITHNTSGKGEAAIRGFTRCSQGRVNDGPFEDRRVIVTLFDGEGCFTLADRWVDGGRWRFEVFFVGPWRRNQTRGM